LNNSSNRNNTVCGIHGDLSAARTSTYPGQFQIDIPLAIQVHEFLVPTGIHDCSPSTVRWTIELYFSIQNLGILLVDPSTITSWPRNPLLGSGTADASLTG
jgi:hypothetical protein